MSVLGFAIEWVACPDEELPAIEQSTWARMGIDLDGQPILKALERGGQAGQPYVEGSLAGLADWIVECWSALLWEIHTPFPKPAATAGGSATVPTLSDAARFWSDVPAEVSRNALGAWQHRHALGHACSDLALPSMVFVADDRDIALVIDKPPRELQPTVELDLVVAPSANPHWFARDDVRVALAGVVDAVIGRAQQDAPARPWADWMTTRWDAARGLESAPDERRRWRLGAPVAEAWPQIVTRFGNAGAASLEGVLTDSAMLDEVAPVNRLGAALVPARRARRGGWTELLGMTGTASLPLFEQGYALAARTRERLRLGDRPVDLEVAAKALGIELKPGPEKSPFRAAVSTDDDGRAVILYSEDWKGQAGLAPHRLGIAAALGRLLAEARPDAAFGAAHGPQARWRSTQRANAFAVELLLPTAGLRRSADSRELSEFYGISRSAAQWHMANRRSVTHPSE